MRLARKLPPVYGREALRLTEAEKDAYAAEGRAPHWRFMLPNFVGDPFTPRRTEVHWHDLVRGAGLDIVVSEVMDKDIPFEPWLARMRCSGAIAARLKKMLETEPLCALLNPHDTDEGYAFTLPEAIVIAAKPKSR